MKQKNLLYAFYKFTLINKFFFYICILFYMNKNLKCRAFLYIAYVYLYIKYFTTYYVKYMQPYNVKYNTLPDLINDI